MEPLKRYLTSPPPGHAILLNGRWGSGKSYQWDRFARSLSEIGLEPVTVSVAGLVSQEQLESALFQASLSEIGNEVVREAATVIGRALLRAVKIEPKDIKLKTDFLPGKTVVCLDDVERFAGEFSILFGFILNLLDKARIHCVLLADERMAVKRFGDEFGVSKERIVGRTVAVSPDISAFSDEVVKGLADAATRELLLSQIQYIKELIGITGTSNLRTVRYFLMEAASLIADIRPVDGSDIRPLISAICFWTLSVSRNVASLDVAATVFRVGGMEVSIHIHANRNKVSAAPDDVVAHAALLLHESGLVDQAAAWPKSAAFAALINGMDADLESIALDFDLRAPDHISEARVLEAAFKGYRQMSDEMLQSAITGALTLLRTGVKGELLEFIEIYRTLRYFRRLGFIAQTESDFDEEMYAAFSRYDAANFTCDQVGLEFLAEHQEAKDLPIWNVVKDLSGRIELLNIAERNKELLAQLVDPFKEVPDLVSSAGMFTGLDPDDYAAELISGAPIATERLSRAIRNTYAIQNSQSFLHSEASFYDALAAALDRGLTVSTPRTISQVSVATARDLLLALAARVRG